MDVMVNGGGTNPAILTPEGANLRQIGRGSMGKDRRTRKLVRVVLIGAAVTALVVAAPPTRTDTLDWTG